MRHQTGENLQIASWEVKGLPRQNGVIFDHSYQVQIPASILARRAINLSNSKKRKNRTAPCQTGKKTGRLQARHYLGPGLLAVSNLPSYHWCKLIIPAKWLNHQYHQPRAALKGNETWPISRHSPIIQ